MPSPLKNKKVIFLPWKGYSWKSSIICLAYISNLLSIILFPYMELGAILSCIISARKKDISNNILNWFLCLFKYMNHVVTLQERICLIVKKNIVHLTRGRALKTSLVASADGLKNFFRTPKVYRNTKSSVNIQF